MEAFSTFLNWVVKTRSGSNDIEHFLDDFFFAGPSLSGVCKSLMVQFLALFEELNVPIARIRRFGRVHLWFIWAII